MAVFGGGHRRKIESMTNCVVLPNEGEFGGPPDIGGPPGSNPRKNLPRPPAEVQYRNLFKNYRSTVTQTEQSSAQEENNSGSAKKSLPHGGAQTRKKTSQKKTKQKS